MFWAPWLQSMPSSQPSFSTSAWKRGGVWMCKLGVISQERLKIEVKLPTSANRKSYMRRWLAQLQMTLSDLEWPCHGSSVSSLWEGRANVSAPCTSSTQKWTSASRAISAVAELLVILCHTVLCFYHCVLGLQFSQLAARVIVNDFLTYWLLQNEMADRFGLKHADVNWF